MVGRDRGLYRAVFLYIFLSFSPAWRSAIARVIWVVSEIVAVSSTGPSSPSSSSIGSGTGVGIIISSSGIFKNFQRFSLLT
ncbi:MAG: hypothetical protein WCP92_05460 [bacterium]